ncbi:N-acetylmuramoyl-L-alanine amidase [Aeromicrobium sp.]|uniref:N-acetylmuramoyl-L-alanine amidase n=1 Tax=Aeromicrobium sp. TaxID=1871063 RepID=UPI0019C46FF8|nr:N-acetylmuramoyl-L-alanine amidase [Aeromicrobium sp.]MBC7630323.1 N-acetylmuramoyl-L-alanine amidase [Aeromicrobium sp.]
MRTVLSPNNGPALRNPFWILIHTAQGARTDESLASFTSRSSSAVGYHYLFDDDSETLTIYESSQSWSALGANAFGVHLCTTGFAEWSRAEWLSHDFMLRTLAARISEIARRRGIPLRRPSDAEIRNHVAGVIGHGDYARATGDGDHTDPGPNFPWDYVLGLAAGVTTNPTEVDDLTPDQDRILRDTLSTAQSSATISSEVRNWIVDPNRGVLKQLGVISGVVSALTAAQSGVSDQAALEAAAERGAKAAIAEIVFVPKAA